MEHLLTEIEVRVLGCLIEKSITVPDHYPLSLNSLTSACNQKSSRDPVMDLDEASVTGALEDLRYNHHLVYHVTTSGSRVPKYRHDAPDVIGLEPPEVAVMCVLMLRGPQTPGEVRTRSSRLYAFDSVAEVVATLDTLAAREDGPLVVKLPRTPGSREQRYQHLLCGEVEAVGQGDAADSESIAPSTPAEDAPIGDAPPVADPMADRVAMLEDEVTALRRDLDALRTELGAG